jgi:hypothetical protein
MRKIRNRADGYINYVKGANGRLLKVANAMIDRMFIVLKTVMIRL